MVRMRLSLSTEMIPSNTLATTLRKIRLFCFSVCDTLAQRLASVMARKTDSTEELMSPAGMWCSSQ